MSTNKVTYEQLSRASGISLSTISRVINKNPNVKDSTRRKVIRAMAEAGMDTASLEHYPQSASQILVFDVPSMRNIFYSPIMTSAKMTASKYGYTMLMNEEMINDATIDRFLLLLRQSKAAGVVSASPLTPEHQARISDVCPLVICCEGGTGEDIVPYVAIDDVEVAMKAIGHLVSIGCKRIAMINGPAPFKYARDRYKGYCKALEAAGYELDSNLLGAVNEDIDYDMAKAVALGMLNSPSRPDGFFCISDVIAAAAVSASKELGLKVPGDVAVVGVDDVIISTAMNPSITTVRQPCAQMGALSVEMLVKLIRGNGHVNPMVLGTELVIRESTTLL